MSGISSIFASDRPDSLSALQGASAKEGTPQANDAFAAMLSQSMNQQPQDGVGQTSGAAAGAARDSRASAPVSPGLAAMGEALASGNISAAQQAFQSSQDELSPAISSATSAQGATGSDPQLTTLLSQMM
jgi:hypothetical protein